MKKKIFIAAAVLISSYAQAQNSTKLLDEVVITATKFPLKTSATGKVLNVITQEELQKAGGRDITQLITEKTGVYINGFNSNIGKDKSVYVRGANPAFTLITIDGIPVYDASGIGGNFDLRNMAIDNVERIEILKGSQSSLYGNSAVGGTINIFTKKGRLGKHQDAAVRYGENNSQDIFYSIDGANEKQGRQQHGGDAVLHAPSHPHHVTLQPSGFALSGDDGFHEVSRHHGREHPRHHQRLPRYGSHL